MESLKIMKKTKLWKNSKTDDNGEEVYKITNVLFEMS